MRESRISFQWQRNSAPAYRTGVSLHSHTLHSKESLDFVDRATANTPWLGGAIRKQKAKYKALKGYELDLKRAWWTPPLSARQAWDLERKQIERTLGLGALVSLSDHDNIDAGVTLHALERMRECPISIEWTIPYRLTFFHVGVHNLPVDAAREMERAMQAFTADPQEARIAEMLEWAGASPETLVILNHPMWDENHIGEALHTETVTAFLDAYLPFIHALELNGLRPWAENRKAAQLAEKYSLPVISGGDRHGKEPNACVNLSNAGTFAEFVTEVRRDGQSEVLFMPHYRETLKMRILENMCDIIEDDPKHALGWVKWSDRVFFRNDDGNVLSLTEFFAGKGYPGVINRFVSLMALARHRRVRKVIRMALHEKAAIEV